MKANVNSTGRPFGLACIAIWLAIQAWPASVSGKNLIVTGEGFDRDAVILIDGVEQRTRNDESKPETMLTGKKAAKNIFPGQPVNIRVRNSDGLLSESFSFTRLP